MADKHVGQLSFARIYSGPLKAGSYALNSTKDARERVGRIMKMHANKREDLDVAYAGEIVAVAGLKQVTTGDTICAESHPVILEAMDFPAPVISLAIEPKTRPDQEKLGVALGRLARRTHHSASRLTRRLIRRLFPEWANCILKSSLIA